MITSLLVFTSVTILTYLFFVKPHQYWRNKNVPQLKITLPIIGDGLPVFSARKNIHEWLRMLYNNANTRVLGIYSFHMPLLIVRDINLIKQMTIKDFDYFTDHQPCLPEEFDSLFGKNLFSMRGNEWRNMRSTLSPAFTGSKMRKMFSLMSDCAKRYTNYLVNKVGDKEIYELEMKDTFTRYANDVIATTAFGIECNSLENRTNEFYMMVQDVSDINVIRQIKICAYTVCTRLMRFLNVKIFSEELCNFFRTLVKTTIETREKHGIVRPDMIHLLMEARKGKLKHEFSKNDDAGFATVDESDVGKSEKQKTVELTDDVITAQAVLFFTAGFEPISTAMCLMAYQLAIYEDIQQKLQEEIDETLAECNEEITYDIVAKMKYLDMVFSETLRLLPPACALTRVCTKPYTIQPESRDEKPMRLDIKDIIWFPVSAIHMDPQFYPNPEKFDPERFSDENKHKIQPATYIPFGIGPRNCIGSRYALMEGKIIFIHLLSKFSLTLTKKSDVPLKFKKGELNLKPVNGYWLGLKKRII